MALEITVIGSVCVAALACALADPPAQTPRWMFPVFTGLLGTAALLVLAGLLAGQIDLALASFAPTGVALQLAIWVFCRPGPDGDDESDEDQPDDDPDGPGGSGIDWERFNREFWREVDRQRPAIPV